MIYLSIVKLIFATHIHLLKVTIMKNVKTLFVAAVLSSLSFASFVAVEVQATPAGQQKVGTISANAGTNVGSLGAKSFRITSVTGPNTLHGTAVIYK